MVPVEVAPATSKSFGFSASMVSVVQVVMRISQGLAKNGVAIVNTGHLHGPMAEKCRP